jgi:hypothetical protein
MSDVRWLAFSLFAWLAFRAFVAACRAGLGHSITRIRRAAKELN